MHQTVGGSVNCSHDKNVETCAKQLVNCWLLIVKKRGYTKNGRTQHNDGTTGCTTSRRVRKREQKKNTRNSSVE